MQAGEMTQAQMQAQFEQYQRQLAEAQQAEMAHHHEEASFGCSFIRFEFATFGCSHNSKAQRLIYKYAQNCSPL